MTTAIRGLFFALLTAFLEGNANAQISMAEREHVQSIAWVFEFVTLLTIVVIVWFVWRISKKDYKSKKSNRNNS